MTNIKNVQISVIIPCYNCEQTIRRAVKSVYDQTMRPAEVILIDDASRDGTWKRLSALQEQYGSSWLKLISLKINSGPSGARNAGWDVASQPYIAFLDADDSWHPQKVEIQYNWMILHPEVDVTSHLYTWVKGDAPDYNLPTNWQTKRIPRTKLLLKNYISTPTVMLKRDTPYRFNPQKRYSEDYLLWLTILLQGYSIWQLELPLAYLYKAPYGQGGLSRNLNEMELGELENYMFLQKQGLLAKWEVKVLSIWSQLKYFKRLLLTNLLKGYK
jgi:glycosyltransferase involved in cell wall biosynthesis